MHARQPKFLPAYLLHLFAHDRFDFAKGSETKRSHRIVTGHELSHEAGANQQFVGNRFSVGGIVSKSGDESARPAHGLLLFRPLGPDSVGELSRLIRNCSGGGRRGREPVGQRPAQPHERGNIAPLYIRARLAPAPVSQPKPKVRGRAPQRPPQSHRPELDRLVKSAIRREIRPR